MVSKLSLCIVVVLVVVTSEEWVVAELLKCGVVKVTVVILKLGLVVGITAPTRI